MIPGVFVQRIDWDGITVEVSYEPDWLKLSESLGVPMAHLQVKSVAPERAALPFTETGYKSLFPTVSEVVALGGPLEFVRAWLDCEAQSPAWKASVDASRQLTLL